MRIPHASSRGFGHVSSRLFLTCAFRPNDQCYGHIHDIVCSNVPVFYAGMHLGTENNVAEVIFHFLFTKKLFFHFSSAKNGFFLETTKNLFQNCHNNIKIY
jgi:hypothetical protein